MISVENSKTWFLFISLHYLNEIYGKKIFTVAQRLVCIVLVHSCVPFFTRHTTQALIKCPLFLITFDLIYPTFLVTCNIYLTLSTLLPDLNAWVAFNKQLILREELSSPRFFVRVACFLSLFVSSYYMSLRSEFSIAISATT